MYSSELYFKNLQDIQTMKNKNKVVQFQRNLLRSQAKLTMKLHFFVNAQPQYLVAGKWRK